MELEDIDFIAEHVDGCGLCLARLESFQPGPLEHGIRIAATDVQRPEGDDDSRIESDAQKVLDSVFPDVPDTVVSHRGSDLYRLQSRIGTAALGVFYQAFDLVMEQEVTVMIPDVGLISSVDHRSQLTLDGTNASGLRHKNILRIIQFGNWDQNLCYFAMPAVSEMSLAQVIQYGVKFNLTGVLLILGQICQAVQYAHRHNIIHRHLNPTNVYLNEYLEVKVAEFGLICDGRYHFELYERIVFPSSYNSPEAIRNEPKRIDVRTDIYSVGAILDALLDQAPDIEPLNAQVLRDISYKCQRNSRKKRYQRIEDLIDDVGKRVEV